MWQVARDSIYRYEFDEEGDVTNISRCKYIGNTPDITIRDIENTGNVWISTSLGLSRLTAQGNTLKFTPIHTVLQKLKGLFVTDLLRQGSTVWIATNQGLYAYHLFHNTLRDFRHSAGTTPAVPALSVGIPQRQAFPCLATSSDACSTIMVSYG